MMFIQFFTWGAWYVTAYLFLGKIGFEPGDVGWTYSVGPIAGMISPFVVGMIADRFFATERVLGVMHLLGGGAMLAASAMMAGDNPSPTLINFLFFAHMLCYYPTLSLTNSLALHNMTNAEKQFPLIRVFGTIGWIIAGWVVSSQGWDASINLFRLAGGSAIVMGLYSFTLPHTPPPAAGKKPTAWELLGLDAIVLLKKPSFLVFMVSSFLICIPLAFYYQLAGKYVDHAGIANPAFAMSFGQISEIFFMLIMPLFFAALGVKWMLFVGMLAWVIRYAMFSVGADDGVFWMVMGGILLHGICYDFFFVTGQIYTDRVAPKHIRSQAQGMLVLFTLGLGMMIGAQVTGRVEGAFTSPDAKALGDEAGAVGEQMATRQTSIDKLRGTADASWLNKQMLFFFPKSLSAEDQQQVAQLEKEIGELRAQRADILRKTVDWKSVWKWPAIGAGLIMVLFALSFFDKTARTEDAAAAHGAA